MFNLFKRNETKKPIISYMEAHIVDYCNLNCDYCAHFSHLVNDNILIDIEEYKKDLDELSKKINVIMFRIIGGEPLLHPQINKFMIATRKSFPNTRISVVTNGILLKQMDETFWNTLKSNNIFIDLTKYPIFGNKFSELLDLIDDHDMQPGHIKLAKKFYESLNPKGDSDINKSYKICGSKRCVNLWHHKLYPCQACFRYYYNQKYNTKLALPPSIDIYENSGAEIIQTLKEYQKPFDACRFCLEEGIVREWKQYKED